MGEAEGRQAEEDDLSGRSQTHRSGAEGQVGKGKGPQVIVVNNVDLGNGLLMRQAILRNESLLFLVMDHQRHHAHSGTLRPRASLHTRSLPRERDRRRRKGNARGRKQV